MLNREVCEMCKDRDGIKWKPFSRKWWESGSFICHKTPTVLKVSVRGSPPLQCPFRLEHLMAEQKC